MKTVLIFGVTGMLGHKMAQVLSLSHRVIGTVQGSTGQYSTHPILSRLQLIGNVQAGDLDSVINAINIARPLAILNCIGIIKQDPAANDRAISTAVNAMFPHRLAALCRTAGIRLIHFSTDCVFSGRKGNYSENDVTDAEDVYGRSKFLGEVDGEGCLTLRTSIIGRELRGRRGLLEWFLSCRGGTVSGYDKVIYSGFPTIAMANLVDAILTTYPPMSGVWHVSSNPISKYELLSLLNDAFQTGITINRDDKIVCDRSLDSTRFRRTTGFTPLSWEAMIEQMASDSTPYDEMREQS